MLQVEYRLKMGQDEFLIKAEVKDEKEFFEQMSFYSSLPKTAPGGSTDLKLSFRITTQGHKYYSLVSEKEKLEFKFGQNMENKGGGLFPKGWDKLYEKDQDQSNGSVVTIGQQTVSASATIAVGPQTMPQPQVVTTPSQATPGVVTQTKTAPTTQVSPATVAAANNVLSRFGIKTT